MDDRPPTRRPSHRHRCRHHGDWLRIARLRWNRPCAVRGSAARFGDRSFIPGPMLFAGVLLALMTAYRERTAIDAAALRSSLIGLAGGTIVGVVTLKFVSD